MRQGGREVESSPSEDVADGADSLIAVLRMSVVVRGAGNGSDMTEGKRLESEAVLVGFHLAKGELEVSINDVSLPSSSPSPCRPLLLVLLL
jgi:hypothetical protein